MIRSWFRRWYYVPLLFLISALAYLPNISHFGYFRDDWYLMYSANAIGSDVFQNIYAIDRPMRAFVMSAMYSVFGINPVYYNISAYILRVLGALAFLWTLQLLWPRQRSIAIFASILFLVYPGFLSTPNGIDYQAQQLGLFLAHLSVAFSVKAVLSTRRAHQVALWSLSVLLTWIYLGLVEYFFGLEFFRLAVIGALAGRQPGINIWQWIKDAFLRWLPFAAGSLGFAVWRFFLFDSERKATDLCAQLRLFFDSPLLTGIGWTTTLLKDVFEILLLSWGVPLANLWDISLRVREMLFAGILVALSILVVLVILKFEKDEQVEEAGHVLWETEAFWLGLTCAAAGFVPVILSNRNADFYGLSRYMLASSSGAVIVLMVFIHQLRWRNVRSVILCLLVGISVLTHHLNGIQWARSSAAMQDFWWQVSWRIPRLEPGTTLVVNYSHTSVEEDYFVWGPANFIYYPQSMDAHRVRPALSALVLNRASLVLIQTSARPMTLNRRSILTNIDYGNILILTQPTSASCVQVIDGEFPVLSEVEQYDISLVAGASDPKNIILNTQSPPPPQIVFGSEPEHDWCFYYQTASLAYQRGDWDTVVNLGQKARRMGFSAGDAVEWMPFLQAATLLGDRDEIMLLAPKIKKSEFLALQACRVLAAMPDLDEDSRSFAVKIFCEAGR
jgi:hypothetical protein